MSVARLPLALWEEFGGGQIDENDEGPPRALPPGDEYWTAAAARIRERAGLRCPDLELIAIEIESHTEPHGGSSPPYLQGKQFGLRLAAAIVREATSWHDDGDEHTGPDCLNPAHFEDDLS